MGRIYYLEGINDGRMDRVDFGITNPDTSNEPTRDSGIADITKYNIKTATTHN